MNPHQGCSQAKVKYIKVKCIKRKTDLILIWFNPMVEIYTPDNAISGNEPSSEMLTSQSQIHQSQIYKAKNQFVLIWFNPMLEIYTPDNAISS